MIVQRVKPLFYLRFFFNFEVFLPHEFMRTGLAPAQETNAIREV